MREEQKKYLFNEYMNTFLLKSGWQGNELAEDSDAYRFHNNTPRPPHPPPIPLSKGKIVRAIILSPLPSAPSQ